MGSLSIETFRNKGLIEPFEMTVVKFLASSTFTTNQSCSTEIVPWKKMNEHVTSFHE